MYTGPFYKSAVKREEMRTQNRIKDSNIINTEKMELKTSHVSPLSKRNPRMYDGEEHRSEI